MKKWIVGGIVLAVIAGGFFVFGKEKKPGQTVKTTAVTVGNIDAYLSTTAAVKSKERKEYYGTQAQIKEVYVKVGDYIKKGDILVSYKTEDLTNSIKQAQIQYNNAVLQRRDLYNQNDDIKDKMNDLDAQIKKLEKSKDPADAAKLESLKQQKEAMSPISTEKLKQADNSVQLAKISLEMVKDKKEDIKSSITAENAGVVTDVTVTEGAVGNMAQPAVIIQDLENLKAVVSLGKYDAQKIKIGQSAKIKGVNTVYNGSVFFIDPVAHQKVSASGNEVIVNAEIDILKKSPELKIDLDVDADILIGQAKQVVKVPVEAIKLVKGNKNLVYVVKNNIVEERQVKVGLQSDREAQILEGVKIGEKVILNPSTSITNGLQVQEFKGGGKE